jgi:hypothetical protein
VLCGKTGFVGFAFVIVKVFLQCWPNFRLEQTSAQSNKAQHRFQHEKWQDLALFSTTENITSSPYTHNENSHPAVAWLLLKSVLMYFTKALFFNFF